jgi:hypothetical protein
VSENIYGGTNANTDTAWTFWLNSAIHFQGMVSTNYQEVGIGVAHGGWGAAFVMVFGGVGAPPPVAGSSNSGGQQAAAGPPAYVGGLDEHGNIKHIVQPGDTLGDIALIYGYTWSDLPYMMQLNGLSDVRDLEVGSIFLVPPRDGTFTPAPDSGAPPTEAAPAEASAAPVVGATVTALAPTITPYVVTTPTLPPEIVELTVIVPPLSSAIATAGGDIMPPGFDTPTDAAPTPEAQAVAAVPTSEGVRAAGVITPRASSSTWILIAVGVQVLVVVGAGVEFLRRAIRKRR